MTEQMGLLETMYWCRAMRDSIPLRCPNHHFFGWWDSPHR